MKYIIDLVVWLGPEALMALILLSVAAPLGFIVHAWDWWTARKARLERFDGTPPHEDCACRFCVAWKANLR